MDGPEDPLLTARTGGLASVVSLQDADVRGSLGEVVVVGKDGSSSKVTRLRGVRVAQIASGYGRCCVVDVFGKVLPIWESSCGEEDVDLKMESVAFGNGFAAGIGLEDSRLYSWGKDGMGQLGLGHTRGSKVAEVVNAVSNGEFVQVSCGNSHGAVLASDGTVYTWGRGMEGQLGEGLIKETDLDVDGQLGFRMVPRSVQALHGSKVKQVASGANFCAALDEKGCVWTWGTSLCGELGDGKRTKRSLPAIVFGPEQKTGPQEEQKEKRFPAIKDTCDVGQIETERKIEGIACGESHVLCFDCNGKLYAWGFNAFGQLGLGDHETRFYPVEAKPIQGKVRSVSAEKHMSLVVDETGKCLRWGKKTSSPERIIPLSQKPDAEVSLAAVLGSGDSIVLMPTRLAGISPSNGPVHGGHEISFEGIGFWESGCIRVRFVPMHKGSNNSEHEEASVDLNVEKEFNLDQISLRDDEEEDDESLLDSTEDEFGTKKDPREIVEVDGYFDEEMGLVRCIAPPSRVPGVSQVQLAITGVDFTQDEIFFAHIEDVNVEGMENCSFTCDDMNPDKVAELTVVGSGFMAFPELALRLAASDGTVFDLKGEFKVSQNEDPEMIQQTVHAQFSPLKVHEHFSASAQNGIVSLVVSVSLNGLQFSKCAENIIIANQRVQSCFPSSLPSTSESDQRRIKIKCGGLHSGIKEACVQLRNEKSGALEEIDDVEVNSETALVCFSMPQNETGAVEISLSFDKRQSWMKLRDHFVLYPKEIGAVPNEVRPTLIPISGTTIEIPFKPGTLFKEIEPKARIVFEGENTLLHITNITTDEDLTFLKVGTGNLERIYKDIQMSVWDSVRDEQFKEFIYSNPLPEGHTDNDENQRQAEAEKIAERAAEQALKSYVVKVDLEIALNGQDFAQIEDSLVVFKDPRAVEIRPNSFTLCEKKFEEIRIRFESECVIPDPENPSVRFSRKSDAYMVDIPAFFEEAAAEDACELKVEEVMLQTGIWGISVSWNGHDFFRSDLFLTVHQGENDDECECEQGVTT